MFKKLSLSILSLCVASICLANTQAYIHTNRNEAKITNGSNAFNKNDLAPATGLVVDTQEGQRVSLVTSAKLVLDIPEKTRLSITEATQASPISYEKENIYEINPTTTKLKLDYGKAYLSMPIRRPTSIFEVTTPLGTYTLNCRYFRIESKKNVDEVLIYEGDVSFFDSKNRIVLGESTLTTLDNSRGRIRTKINRASLNPEDSLKRQFKDSQTVFETTHFDTKDGLKAQRVLPRNAKVESLENSHYKN